MNRTVCAFLIGLTLHFSAAFGSQNNLWNPTTGTLSGLTQVQNDNNALDSLNTCNSGASAPTNQLSGVPSLGNCWLNTTTGALQIYDGADWLITGWVDFSGHVWTPIIGGNSSASVTAASTTNLCGSSGIPPVGSYLTISGTTTIAGFGSNCVVGQVKILTFSGILQLTNSGSLSVPGGTQNTAAGDVAVAIYLGSSNWKIAIYQHATGTGVAAIALTGYGGLNAAGTCSGSTITCNFGTPGGSLNRFRNGSFVIDSRGGGSAVTVGTSGNYGPDGWKVFFVGSSNLTYTIQPGGTGGGGTGVWNYLSLTGGASNTDLKIAQRIEAQQAQPLAGVQVTAQFVFFNNSGGSATPKISSCAASVTNNFATCTTDLAATSLTACPNANICLESYSWSATANAERGYEVDFDCNTSATGSNYCAFAQADIRPTPGATTGFPPVVAPPEIHSFAQEVVDNGIWLSTSYDNGVAPGTATALGLSGGNLNNGTSNYPLFIPFKSKMFCDPSAVSYWDAAGNATKYSTMTNDSTTNNVGTVTVQNISQSGFQIYNASGSAFLHYLASCEL